jgi:hypothetical protein
MARTPDQIATSLETSINTTDPSVVVKYGPIRDLEILPISNELATTEETADHLALLYSTEFQKTATDAEVLALQTNFSQTPSPGTYSEGYCYFYRYSRPLTGQSFTVPVGALVGNFDRSKIVSALEEITLDGSNPDAFYNATKKVYEVRVHMRATATGKDYDLPSTRYNTMVSKIDGFDGVENRGDFAGGNPAETNLQQVERVQTRFQGLNSGDVGGMVSIVKNYDPINIVDV